MSVQYTYSIESDFPNQQVSIEGLTDEIRNSDITIALDYINKENGFCEIFFKTSISTEEKTILDNIVSNHDGVFQPSELPQKVKVYEEGVESSKQDYLTQGQYQGNSFVIDVPAQTGWTYTDFSFPYYISMFSAEWFTSETHIGDIASFEIAPNTLIGLITSDINSGDTTFYVDDSVIENVKLGFSIKIGDDYLGRIFDIDNENNTITTEFATSNNYFAADNVLVKMTMKLVVEYHFIHTGKNEMGKEKIGSEVIPPNTVMRINYYNNDGVAKKFGFFLTYYY